MKKRLFFLTASLIFAVMSFAQPVTTVTKLWSGSAATLGWNTSSTRQWAGYGEYVYWADDNYSGGRIRSIVGTRDGINVDTVIVNNLIDGAGFCVDGAGNWIVSGVFPATPSHLFIVKRADTTFVNIPITGLARTDIATASGDVFSEEGGCVFLYGNSANLLIVSIKNAGAANQEVTTKTIAIKGSNVQNYVVAGDTAVQYVQRRSSGQTGFDKYVNGVNTGSITGMTGYKHTTLGGAMVTLAGQEFAIYPSGSTNYSSEFSVVNLTSGQLVGSGYCANTTNAANSADVGIYATVTKIDEYSAYIQVGNGADGAALFKLTVPKLYEIGANQPGGWAPNVGTLMDVVAPNIYRGSFVFEANETFAFTTDLAENKDQGGWDYISSLRYGAAENDQMIADGDTIINNTNAFKIPADGYYTITVNFNTKKVEVVAAQAKVSIAGTFPGATAWTTNLHVLTEANDHLSTSKTIHLDAGSYLFKVVLNDADWISTGTDDQIDRRYNTKSNLETGHGNYNFIADIAGDYEFVFTYADNSLDITFPDFVREAANTNYQSLCTPFDATVVGATAYEFISADASGVNVRSVDALVAGHSYLLKPDAAGNIAINYVADGAITLTPANPGNNETGLFGELINTWDYIYNEQTGWRNVFVLLDDDMFHQVRANGVVTITPTRAYLRIAGEEITGPTTAAPIRIIENATDIQSIEGLEKAVKFIKNGQLYIQKDGVVYTATGVAVK